MSRSRITRRRAALSASVAASICVIPLAAAYPATAHGAGHAAVQRAGHPLGNSAGKAAGSGGSFADPGTQAKPMARTWFPDAGAGESQAGLDLVAKQIRDLAAGGFGGAEIAFLSDNTNYTNDDAKIIGFGSPNWQKVLTTIFRTANSIPGGFKIDLTITSHWPVATNNIDPNDDAQQQEARTAYTKITAADLAAGTMDLPLPTERTRDFSNTSSLIADFLFVSKYTSASIAQVTSITNGTPTFKLASLSDVSGATTKKTVTAAEAQAGTAYKNVNGTLYAGHAAGVPDEAYADAHGIDYSTVLKQWGPAAAPGTVGKIDADGNRKRMADWQYEYQTNLSDVSALQNYTPSAGSDLAVGDYVLLGNYHEGTGQIMSGGASVTQYARPYAESLYNKAGVDAIKQFYAQKILDPELIRLMRANAAKNPSDAMFEDSLEMHHDDGPLWDSGVLADLQRRYGINAAQYATLFSLGSSASFDDTTEAGRLLEDYNAAMGDLWRTNHIAGLNKWAATFGYKYKMQPEGGAVGISGAEASLRVEEGDNAATSDGYRNLAAAANISGTNLVSLEGLTFEANSYNTTWKTLAQALNGYWAGGVNRVNFHGSPFPKTFNDYHSSWPGWTFGLGSSGFGVFDARQPFWQDMPELSDYVARTQAVLQSGVAKVDVAVLEGSSQRYSLASGTAFPALLNAGYSYNVLDESMLGLKGMKVTGKTLDTTGPAYKAIVVNKASQLSVATVNTLIGYARAGLPVILDNSDVASVYGTDRAGDNDDLLAQRMAVLKSLAVTLGTSDDLASYLSAHGVHGAAQYAAPGLQTIHRASANSDSYYLYASGTTLASAAQAGDTTITVGDASGLSAGEKVNLDSGANLETVTIASISGTTLTLTAPLTKDHAGPAAGSGGPFQGASGAGVSGIVNTPITLTGTGVPLLEDPYTGAVTPITDYTRSGDTVTFDLTLNQADAAIISLSGNNAHGGKTPAGSSNTADASASLNDGWNLTLHSWGPGDDANNPSISTVTTTNFTNLPLGSWSDLPATADQLSALGVTSMSQVSGVGTYSRSFTLPANWSAAKDGGYLTLGHLSDMVTKVVVNGHQLPAVDLFTDTADAAPYLHAGSNTISVTIDTTFNNRTSSSATGYGLTSVTLTTDGQTKVQ